MESKGRKGTPDHMDPLEQAFESTPEGPVTEGKSRVKADDDQETKHGERTSYSEQLKRL
ncbi:hypothetical protein [Salinithrix halophila]|uniref:YfhD-like protein n=1 Tax=Salinithrix halophila TaxID=1485204 RepID=A0ABV8JCC3_9BACL